MDGTAKWNSLFEIDLGPQFMGLPDVQTMNQGKSGKAITQPAGDGLLGNQWKTLLHIRPANYLPLHTSLSRKMWAIQLCYGFE